MLISRSTDHHRRWQQCWLFILLTAALFAEWPATGFADARDIESNEAPPILQDAPVGSDNDLLLFQDVPMVVSGSRQAQPLNLSSTPISIITADDIHYSGLTNIPELLQFVPGMDVLRVDRNRYAVGVRGLHDVFADRTLTLIDGRAAGSPVFGGADWTALPLLMEDIERIEVVRGPGGAAWGANALNGVINIITKDPADVRGVFLTSTVNEFGDTYNEVRWGHSSGDWRWRTSLGYESLETSDAAIDDSDFRSLDFARSMRFNGAAIYEPDRDTKVSMGLGITHQNRGLLETFTTMTDTDDRVEQYRSYIRLDRRLSPDTDLYVQWTGNFEDTEDHAFWLYQSSENDIEASVNIGAIDGHRITLGGNVRITHVAFDADAASQLTFADEPFTEYSAGLFVTDRWQIDDHLALEAQVRGDIFSATDGDWSGRLSALWSLDDAQHHVVRFSAARAFRVPSLDLRESFARLLPLPSPPFAPDSFALTFVGNDALKNESVWSFEAGYTGRVNDWLTCRIDGYYQIIDNMLGIRTVSSSMGGLVSTIAVDDDASARAWGVEAEATAHFGQASVSAWYAYNDIDVDFSAGQDIRSLQPAQHKAGLTGRLTLDEQWTANANYRFMSTTEGDPFFTPSTKPSHRFDITLTHRFKDFDGEMTVGIQDLLDDGAQRTGGYIGGPTTDTPGRAVFARFQVHF